MSGTTGDTAALPIFTSPSVALQTYAGASATTAATAGAPALAAVAGKTNFVTGFSISGSGATGASTIAITLTGLLGGTQTFYLSIPAIGSTPAIVPFIVNFNPPLPASAVNTAITLNVPSFGAGNITVAANIYGFVQ